MTRDRYGEPTEDDTADDAEAHTCDAGWIDREADHPRPCLTCPALVHHHDYRPEEDSMLASDPDVTDDERADITRLVQQLPSDLDHAAGSAMRALRERYGITPGHIWPTTNRLGLALRVVGDRRRQAARRAGGPR